MARPKEKPIKLREHEFIVPSKEELIADGVVATSDGSTTRRVVIPSAAFWARMKLAGRRDAETMIRYTLQTFGIHPDHDFDKLAEAGFITYSQALHLGVEETQAAAEEEAREGGLIQKLFMALSEDDAVDLVAKRFDWKTESLKEALGL